MYFKTIIWH